MWSHNVEKRRAWLQVIKARNHHQAARPHSIVIQDQLIPVTRALSGKHLKHSKGPRRANRTEYLRACCMQALLCRTTRPPLNNTPMGYAESLISVASTQDYPPCQVPRRNRIFKTVMAALSTSLYVPSQPLQG